MSDSTEIVLTSDGSTVTSAQNNNDDSKNNPAPNNNNDDGGLTQEEKKIIERAKIVQAEMQSTQIENIKSAYDLIQKIDEKTKAEIEKQFAEGLIQLEEVDEEGNVKPFITKYRPLTTRGEEAVNKMSRELRVFRADIKNNLPLEDMQKKYPELMDGIESLEEIKPDKAKVPKYATDKDGVPVKDKRGNLIQIGETEEDRDSETFTSIVDNYVTKKKAKIFFGINDIGNFSRKDLRALIQLYQFRNNYNPYYVNPT